MPASTMMHGLLLRYHYTILYSTLLLFLFSITSWILLKQSFLSPSWPLSLRPSASWAFDSEPIRARGIIVNYTTILLYYTISYYYYMVLQGCYWHGQGCSILVTGVWAMASDLLLIHQILLTCPRLSSVAFILVCLWLMCEKFHF